MKIVIIAPERIYTLDDPVHHDRWMCPRCGLILDYMFSPGEVGWPKFDPPIDEPDYYYDEEGEVQLEEPDRTQMCPRCDLSFEVKPPILVAVTPMTRLQDLLPIIQAGEGIHTDFMREFPANASHLRDAVAAFATTEGGRVFLGVDNHGQVVGLPDVHDPDGKDAFLRRVRGLLGAIEPKPEIRVDFVSDDAGTTVAVVTVVRGPSPIYLSGNVAYIRELDQSRPATPDEIQRLVRRRRSRRLPKTT